MKKANFNTLKNLPVPEKWLENALAVPEKAEATVKTVTEKIVPANVSNADSLFESEIISPDSRTAPLPNLDPEATTPLEKQDMSAQSKVSKAYDALFEEDES